LRTASPPPLAPQVVTPKAIPPCFTFGQEIFSSIATITGGLSGPCVKPVALRMVWQTYKAVKIPIIGLGGISNWKDAVEFMLAGATAIQIGTYNFVDPAVGIKVIEGMNDYCDRHWFFVCPRTDRSFGSIKTG